ncbi:MAG: hypothetical protein F6K30_23905, partial [Cyanothece sp. SIO2G6]|nr:hypothetical protein [Cyanothece sp. SIO2G6]
KTIVFPLAHYWFALPVPAILRVIRFDEGMAAEMARNGFVMLDGQPLSTVDLRSRLFADPTNPSPQLAQLPSASSSPEVSLADATVPCLLTIQANRGKNWALRVDHLPELLELPLSCVHPISSTAPPNIRAIAHHMAILSSQSSHYLAHRPIFLMDLTTIHPHSQVV